MFWYFEGRVYNAPKQGAKVIKARSPMEASHIAATQIESEKTFGLGEGGNKAVFPRQDASVSGVDYQQRRHHQKKGEKLRGRAEKPIGPDPTHLFKSETDAVACRGNATFYERER